MFKPSSFNQSSMNNTFDKSSMIDTSTNTTTTPTPTNTTANSNIDIDVDIDNDTSHFSNLPLTLQNNQNILQQQHILQQQNINISQDSQYQQDLHTHDTNNLNAHPHDNNVGLNSPHNLPIEICPSTWLGSFNSITNSNFINDSNIKIIINCSPIQKFLKFFNNPSSNLIIPSNIIILNLDPNFSISSLNEDEQFQLMEFNQIYNKILQNYVNHFYKFNSNSNLKYLIHNSNFENLSISSNLLTGNLLNQFFNINRFIKLFKNIDSSCQILILSEFGDSKLSTSLLISNLMDNYNYNFDACYNLIKFKNDKIQKFNINYYDDLLMIENCKKFYQENNLIKLQNPNYLTSNFNCKRKNNDFDDDVNCRGSERRRKIYPKKRIYN